MQTMFLISVYAFTLLLAWLLTGWVQRYALNRTILDIPNHRSLHASPTPRGGGLGIVIPVLLATVLLAGAGQLPMPFALAIGGGGLMVAGIGWLDDLLSVPAALRFLVYIIAAGWACYWLVSAHGVYVIFTYAFWVVAISWLTNLYNFMDGSDALAATQATFVALATAIMLLIAGNSGMAILLWVLAASCCGFLIWNWPPARIFMGDTGSCFIGYLFGVSVLQTGQERILSPSIWLILLCLFIADATFTLFRRILRGEQWYVAHRSHAYQLLVQSGLSHRQLVLRVLAVNLLVLLPLAGIVFLYSTYGWGIVGLAYVLAAGVWLLIQSRTRSQQTGTG